MKRNRIILILVALSTVSCGTLAPVETATPTLVPPTATSTQTMPPPTDTPTSTPTPVPDGPCDNPLVPLGVGNKWTYRATNQNGENLYTLESLERRDTTYAIVLVELSSQKSDETAQELVICEDGAILKLPLFVMNMLFVDALDGFLPTYQTKGVYAPAFSTFMENDWNMEWEVEHDTEDSAVIQNPSVGPDIYLLKGYPIKLLFQMDGTREPVTVPAGEFPMALKVHHEFGVSVSLPDGTGRYLKFYTTQWYEPYVGLVRAQVDSASLRSGTQESFIPMQSTLELIEFTTGN